MTEDDEPNGAVSVEEGDATAVIYLRVASQYQHDQQHGIAGQRDACRREAAGLGAVVADEFVDVGMSGNNAERGGLHGLLMRVAKRPVQYVIVRDRSRLARNQADDAAIRAEFERAGATLVVGDGWGGQL
jgi:DNA invertase Pin-like site-specific DNA recombinase